MRTYDSTEVRLYFLRRDVAMRFEQLPGLGLIAGEFFLVLLPPKFGPGVGHGDEVLLDAYRDLEEQRRW